MRKAWYIPPTQVEEPPDYWWKKALLAWGFLSGVLIIAGLAIYAWNQDRRDLATWEALYGWILLICSLWIFFTGKNLKTVAFIGILALLFFPNYLTYLSGGFWGSGARSIWSFLAPFASLILFPGISTLIFFLVFIIAFVFSFFCTQGIPLITNINHPIIIFNLLGWFSVSFTIYYAFYLVLSKQSKEIEEAHLEAESSRLKSNFLNVMSHEIRTPLNAILGLIDLIAEDSKTKSDNVQSLKSASTHLFLLINDILDFSKIHEGRLDLEMQNFNLKECLANAVGLHKGAAERSSTHIYQSWESNFGEWVNGDIARISQILHNLISNAIKFTPGGLVNVTAHVEEREIIITVKDTGIGIPKERHSHIFSPFAQVDASINRKYGGTGLGLAIVKEIVKSCNGELHLESRAGAGCLFTIKLPWHTASPKLEYNSIKTWTKMKILVVDDNSLNVKVAMRLLEKMGMIVHGVLSGQEAIDWLKQNPCDLVLMDLQMPDLDGFNTTRIIHNEINPNIKVVALSAEVKSSISDKLKESNFVDFISKPINLSRLQQWLSDFQNN